MLRITFRIPFYIRNVEFQRYFKESLFYYFLEKAITIKTKICARLIINWNFFYRNKKYH